jgi:hypothetical protein
MVGYYILAILSFFFFFFFFFFVSFINHHHHHHHHFSIIFGICIGIIILPTGWMEWREMLSDYFIVG